MKRSFASMKNETDVFFHSFRNVLQWTSEKIDTFSTFHKVVSGSVGEIWTLLSVTCQIIVVFVVTSIPGVDLSVFCHIDNYVQTIHLSACDYCYTYRTLFTVGGSFISL